nr:ferric reductase-like transmembrane domain-containing protein [Sphingobium subterraneum]
MAVRLMVLALLPGPLAECIGAGRFLRAWLAVRRNLGVAAFLYALLHLAFYAIDMNALSAILEELELPGIWTGWLALALFVPAAATSTDRAMRILRRRWKTIQRVVYAAAAASFLHWLLLDWNWQKAALHAAPLILVWLLRAVRRLPSHQRRPT